MIFIIIFILIYFLYDTIIFNILKLLQLQLINIKYSNIHFYLSNLLENYLIDKLKPNIFVTKNNNIYEIYYNQPSNDVIIYINGGGFISHDNGDLIFAKNTLPKINIIKPISILSIRYSVPNNYKNLHLEILNAYKHIQESGKNIISIIGDSAGCNLILSLLNYIPSINTKILCLISPFINLDINKDKNSSFNNNKDKDIINYKCLDFCINTYCNGINKNNILVSPINNIDKIKKIDKILVIASGNEILYDDIVNFSNKINATIKIYKNKCHCFFIYESFFYFYHDEQIYKDIINFIFNNI